MARFTVKSVDSDGRPMLYGAKEFAKQENDDGSWMTVVLGEDEHGKPWLRLSYGDGKSAVLTEYMDLGKLLYDWASYARVFTLVVPGGDAVSGV